MIVTTAGNNVARVSSLVLLVVAVSACTSQVDDSIDVSDISGPSLEFAEAGEVGMSQEALDKIGPAMHEFVADGRLAGILSVVARKGKIVHWQAQGMSNIAAGDILERDDIFRIFSMTKPITSAAVMILVEDGLIDLDDHVADILPEFIDLKVMDEEGVTSDATQSPTIGQLLSHTGGLTYGPFGSTMVDSLYMASNWFSAPDLDSFSATIASLPLVAQPGSYWNYSVSTDVLGHVVATVSGQSFPAFLEARIFEPLGMDDTGFSVPADKQSRLTTRYLTTDSVLVDTSGDVIVGNERLVAPFPSGGGGLFSTASDYLRFAQMILNEGELDGARILRAETVQEMRRNQLPDPTHRMVATPSRVEAYGFGLGFATLLEAENTPEEDHNGLIRWSGLANTYFWIDPEAELIGMVWAQLDPYFVHDFAGPFQEMVYDAIE